MTIVLVVGLIWGSVVGVSVERISNYYSCKTEKPFYLLSKEYKCQKTGVEKKLVEVKE